MTATAEPVTESSAVWELPQRLGLTADLERLRTCLSTWIAETDPEVRHMIQTQLSGPRQIFSASHDFCLLSLDGGQGASG